MLSEVAERISPLGGWYAAVGVLVAVFVFLLSSSRDDGPPKLEERIPLSNTFEFITDTASFWKRALKTMQSLKTDIIRFRLNNRRVFLVVGESKTNPLFRSGGALSPQYYVNLLTRVMWDPSDKDMARFEADVTGRAREPAAGTEHITDRVWLEWHHVAAEHLARPAATADLAAWFIDRFTARTAELFPLAKTTDTLIWQFLHRHLTECAGRALMGDLIFEKNPDYMEIMADWDKSITPVSFGPPRWLQPKPHRARDRWLELNMRYYAEQVPKFNWDAMPDDGGWEPVFGSPLIRAIARHGLDMGYSLQTIAGMCGQQMSNQNSNSVPATGWCLIDTLTCPDPELLPNLRREARAAITPGADGTSVNLDLAKLLASPWHQAAYVETLRRHIIFTITRDAQRDTELDGFRIPKGSIVQAPMPLAHHNHAAWSVEGHPAEEFWPQRNLKDGKGGEKELSIAGRNGYWFPYGGGITICPGRNFAKQEIIVALGLLLARFDIEVGGWIMPDGTPSDRPARHGDGFVVPRPDRDLKVRMTRRW
ncbi:cytochrome P450 [Echria macrotheca]|uniref:Cytochrome P450 n=1 Tax=Echria macrotheca TaxID=438768 RepID=A0AAJ0F4C2_9PEZI|nr:cytochrome P450 [Echria macrotheca]